MSTDTHQRPHREPYNDDLGLGALTQHNTHSHVTIWGLLAQGTGPYRADTRVLLPQQMTCQETPSRNAELVWLLGQSCQPFLRPGHVLLCRSDLGNMMDW